jgi:phosphatidyl-myo-inositol dimannoside synthase
VNPPCKILFVTLGASGGVGRFERHIVIALDALAKRDDTGVTVLQLRPLNHQVQRVTLRSGGGSKLRFVVMLVVAMIRSPRTVVVFSHPTAAQLTLVFRLFRLHTRYAVLCHGVDVWAPMGRLKLRALQGAAFILAVSSDTARRVTSNRGIEAGRVRLLPCAYLLEGNDDMPSPAPQAGRLKLLSVCRLAPGETTEKGLDLTLAAVRRLAPEFANLTYEIVGEGRDLRRLKAVVHDLGISERVSFAGFLDDRDLKAAYASCDVFVLPSCQEGFGLVFLEAMAAAKPVVAAAAGGVPDVVIPGTTGILIPAGDLDQLVIALRTLLLNPDLRAAYGKGGLAHLSRNFTFELLESRLDSVISDLVGDQI